MPRSVLLLLFVALAGLLVACGQEAPPSAFELMPLYVTAAAVFALAAATGALAQPNPPGETPQKQPAAAQPGTPAAPASSAQGAEPAATPEARRSEAAGNVLSEITAGESRIPDAVLETAECVAVFPQVTTSGADPTASQSLDALAAAKPLDLGHDVEPRIGVLAAAQVKPASDPVVYAYARDAEDLTGFSPTGLLLTADASANTAVYGKHTSSEILAGKGIDVPAPARPFWQALGRQIPKMES